MNVIGGSGDEQIVLLPANNSASLLPSFIRTAVPLVVGICITLAARAALDISDWAPLLTQTVTAGITIAYYSVARFLETNVAPRFGWLIGYAKQPVYVKS